MVLLGKVLPLQLSGDEGQATTVTFQTYYELAIPI